MRHDNGIERLSEAARERLRPISKGAPRPLDPANPDWSGPMLATLTHEPFDDPDWVYERKLDGERCIASRLGDKVALVSRNRQDLSQSYPELRDALAAQAADDFIVDGEIVAFEDGRSSFARLQSRMQIDDEKEARASDVAVYFYLFDLLCVDGQDTTALSLRDRKQLLHDTIAFDDPLRFTPHRNEQGMSYLEEACAKGWEGIIAKRVDAAYKSGRSRKWLKLKCVARQELVVGGYTDPRGSRKGFGALVIGYYEDDRLVCAGKVGTGFDDQTLVDLHAELETLEREDPPFEAGTLPTAKSVHWVEPRLVAEVEFTEWTRDRQLRHPRFLGLRRDKSPRQVTRED